MKKFALTIKKILGVFFLIAFIMSVYLTFTDLKEHLIAALFTCLFFGSIAFLLLKKPKKIAVSSENSSESYPDLTASYTDSENMVAELNSESSRLVQPTHEEITVRWKIPNIIRLIQESYQIMYETDNPETLCSRYKFASSKAEELNYYYRQGWYTDITKINQYTEMLSDENYSRLIFRCYQKYVNKANQELKTKKGVDKRIDKFWSIIQNNVDTEMYIRLRQQ